MPTPHSMATFVKKRSSASKRSLNPPNWSNHRNSTDFSSSKYLLTIDPGTLPASIAAAKSFGRVSTDLPASNNAITASSLFLSLSPSSLLPLPLSSLPLSPPPPPLPPPSPPPLPPPPPVLKVEWVMVVGRLWKVVKVMREGVKRREVVVVVVVGKWWVVMVKVWGEEWW